MIYVVSMDPIPVSAITCIILIILSGIYVFVLLVELISYFSGGNLHLVPVIRDK